MSGANFQMVNCYLTMSNIANLRFLAWQKKLIMKIFIHLQIYQYTKEIAKKINNHSWSYCKRE